MEVASSLRRRAVAAKGENYEVSRDGRERERERERESGGEN